jgi:hypothetical protein
MRRFLSSCRPQQPRGFTRRNISLPSCVGHNLAHSTTRQSSSSLLFLHYSTTRASCHPGAPLAPSIHTVSLESPVTEHDNYISAAQIVDQLRNDIHDVKCSAESRLTLPALAQHYTTLATFLSTQSCDDDAAHDLYTALTLLNSNLHHSLTINMSEEGVHQCLGDILRAVTTPTNADHLSPLVTEQLLLTTQHISEYVNVSVYGPTQLAGSVSSASSSSSASASASYVSLLDDEDPAPQSNACSYAAAPLAGSDVVSLLRGLDELALAPMTHRDRVCSDDMRQAILSMLSKLSDRLRQK